MHFPPLFPLVLAPLFGTLPIPSAAFLGKALNAICFALASGLVAAHAVRIRLLGDAPAWVAPALVALAAVAIPVLTLLGALMSEPLFALLLTGAVILADRSPATWSRWQGPFAAGALAALALLTRSIGVAAGGGILLFAWRKGANLRQLAWVALPVFAAGLAWGLWVLRHKAGIDPAIASDYGSYFETVKSAGLGAMGSSTTDLPRPLSVLTLNWVPSRTVYFALGIPALFGGVDPLLYGFLDTNLHPDVLNAYQALAIDERRAEFPPTLWSSAPAPGQTIEQMWFAGAHCDVGGSYPETSLSDIALGWMMNKALALGLSFDEGVLAKYSDVDAKHALGTIHESWKPLWGFPKPRSIGQTANVASSVQIRWLADASYRPGNLEAVNGTLASTYTWVPVVQGAPATL